jgi:hypothetical protein
VSGLLSVGRPDFLVDNAAILFSENTAHVQRVLVMKATVAFPSSSNLLELLDEILGFAEGDQMYLASGGKIYRVM